MRPPRNGGTIDTAAVDVVPSSFAHAKAGPTTIGLFVGGGVVVESPARDVQPQLITELLNLARRERTTTTVPDPLLFQLLGSDVVVLQKGFVSWGEQEIAGREEAKSLVERVSDELANPEWDFRTVNGLARALGQTPAAIEQVLDENPDLVRWVGATNEHGEQLLVRRSQPVTRRERLLALRSALAKSFA
jgi:hypothetical protein